MILNSNEIVKEVAKSSKVDTRAVRKVIITLYSILINDLLFKGKMSDYLFDIEKIDTNDKDFEFKITKINQDFKKILESKIDSDLVESIVDEGESI